jgi:hypothetical protein
MALHRMAARRSGLAIRESVSAAIGELIVRRLIASTDNQQPQNTMKTNTNPIRPDTSIRRAQASFALALVALTGGVVCIIGGQWPPGLILVFAAVAGVMSAWQLRRP